MSHFISYRVQNSNCVINRKRTHVPRAAQISRQALVTESILVFWDELIDKYITINTNSKAVFTDFEILKLVFYGPKLISVFCQSLCDVMHSIFISGRG